jgi:hypothetical protein
MKMCMKYQQHIYNIIDTLQEKYLKILGLNFIFKTAITKIFNIYNLIIKEPIVTIIN